MLIATAVTCARAVAVSVGDAAIVGDGPTVVTASGVDVGGTAVLVGSGVHVLVAAAVAVAVAVAGAGVGGGSVAVGTAVGGT